MAEVAIPVQMADDAAERVAALAMRGDLERIVEYVRQTIPHLRRLRVTLEYDPACPLAEPQIVIWAQREVVPDEGPLDLPEWDFAGWQGRTFPPQVFVHVSLLVVDGDVDGW